MNSPRIVVVGTGAIGGFYGAKLAATNVDVTFVGRADVATLQATGLKVVSPEGDVFIPHVVATDDPTTIGPVDLVLVTIKTTAQDSLAQLLSPLIRPGTVVVLMQNGFGLETALANRFPEAIVLGGMCFICATRRAPGQIEHLDYGRVTIAQHTTSGIAAGITQAVEDVATLFAQANIAVAARPDLLAARWQKLVWNIPFNGLSVLLDAGTDELVGDPQLRALVRALMNEVVDIAQRHGHPVGDDFVDKMIETTQTMTPYAPSMKLDYEAGRPMELEALYDEPSRQASILDVAIPRIDMLRAQLHFLDQRRGHS